MTRSRLSPELVQRVEAVVQLHPVIAGVVFSHLINGDDVSIIDGNVMIEFGSNRHNVDGPAVLLADVDPKAILSAHFDGEPVDETILAALVRRTLELHDVLASGPPSAYGSPGSYSARAADASASAESTFVSRTDH